LRSFHVKRRREKFCRIGQIRRAADILKSMLKFRLSRRCRDGSGVLACRASAPSMKKLRASAGSYADSFRWKGVALYAAARIVNLKFLFLEVGNGE
jgi:hypothetical protein